MELPISDLVLYLLIVCRENSTHDVLETLPQDTGWSALFFAAEGGDAAITQALIKAGANSNLKDKVQLFLNIAAYNCYC